MRKQRKLDNIKCDVCGYHNHKEYVNYCGICHGCGKVLNEKVYFRYKMNRKLKIWKDDRPDVWTKGNNSIYLAKIKRTKAKGGIRGQGEEEEKVCK